MAPSFLLLLALAASPRFTPAHVLARGEQETVLHVNAPGMFHISAHSGAGTSCVLVDRRRGPFASSGETGRADCALDLILDAGDYQLRLASPAKGKGFVKLSASRFREIEGRALRLVPGSAVQRVLHPREQASFWIRVQKARPISLRLSGRTVGVVKLWRDGKWLEDAPWRDLEPSPEPGRPQHEWWLQGQLPAGEYRVTAYGTQVEAWTSGVTNPDRSDVLSVALGFPKMPSDRMAELKLPSWGMVALWLPEGPVMAQLSAEPGDSAIRLESDRDDPKAGSAIGRYSESACQIAPHGTADACALFARSGGAHVLVVRGKPGTPVRVRWAPLLVNRKMGTGGFGPGTSTLLPFQVPSTGEHLVAASDIPPDSDAPPLSCTLQKSVSSNAGRWSAPDWKEMARDEIAIGPKSPFRRAFNHDGTTSRVVFEITERARYHLVGGEARKASCVLYRLADGQRYVLRPEQSSEHGGCDFHQMLPAGTYELDLGGGTEGIAHVIIAPDGQEHGPDTPTRVACRFDHVSLRKGTDYRVVLSRGGESAARGLFVSTYPLALDSPMRIPLRAGETLELPLRKGHLPVVVDSEGGKLHCEAHNGAWSTVRSWFSSSARSKVTSHRPDRCTFSANTSKTRIANASDGPLMLTLFRKGPPPPRPSPVRFTPHPQRIEPLAVGQARYFDLAPGPEHVFLLEVGRAGLYHVTTLGLLATRCRFRTPTVVSLGEDTSSGRGRNCLLARWLRAGHYLVSVASVGRSRGRTAIEVIRRGATQAAAISPGQPRFFSARAGELISERVNVPTSGSWRLGTFTLGARPQCRLEDSNGWPVTKVPGPCQATFALKKGRYRWMQLPLTVESDRRSTLERVTEPGVLRGTAPHPVHLEGSYAVHLGHEKQNLFDFTVPAKLQVTGSLTGGMVGRLLSLDRKDAHGKPLDVTPDGTPSAEIETTLDAGKYRLVARQAVGDVEVDYTLDLSTPTLAPGLEMDASFPSRIPLRIPVDGILRLRTQSDSDMRCRLLDDQGRAIGRGADQGADWNCGLAQPISAGDYTVALESISGGSGSTRLRADLMKDALRGELPADSEVELDKAVERYTLPELGGSVVREVDLTSDGKFSCSLASPEGHEAFRRTGVKRCEVLAKFDAGRPILRVWSLGSAVRVKAHRRTHPIQGRLSERVKGGVAAEAMIDTPGRYRTASGVFCLSSRRDGALRPCGPVASLDEGPVVFAVRGGKSWRLPLNERIAKVGRRAKPEAMALNRVPFVQRERASSVALHLLEVRVPEGAPASPQCSVHPERSPNGAESKAQRLSPTRCIAASAGRDAIVRASLPVRAQAIASVLRRAVPLPARSQSLPLGRHALSWKGHLGRFALPKGPSHLDLALARGSWAILRGASGQPSDLCAPENALGECAFDAGGGGELLLYAPGRKRAQSNLWELPSSAESHRLTRRFEEAPHAPGWIHLRIDAASSPRTVEAMGATHCELILEDGRHVSADEMAAPASCRMAVPPGVGAQLDLDASTSPLRVLLYAARKRGEALLTPPHSSTVERLPESVAVPLKGDRFVRTLSLDAASSVSVRADSGVCGIFHESTLLASSGFGGACRIDRVLAPGNYVLVARPFADVPLHGQVRWTHARVSPLAEGVNARQILSPGEVRFFALEVQSARHVGLGIQTPEDVLRCRLFDAHGTLLGRGCQQYRKLSTGRYFFAIGVPGGSPPVEVRPVAFGLKPPREGVPEKYLRDFFTRIGATR